MRELREETGLNGLAWQYIGEHSHHYPDRQLRFSLFSCRCDAGSALRCESAHAWAALAAVATYPMPAANRAMLDMLGLSRQDGGESSTRD